MRIQSILCLGLLICCLACQDKAVEVVIEQPPLVQPPIPKLNPDFEHFTWLAEEGFVQDFPNGSQVQIPANALVDEKGQLISGEVELQYRELHDAMSIYLAGVPMSYPTPDAKAQFSTAGTFELRVFQQNSPVYLDSTASASVRLASYESDDDYDFYFLNEESRRWDSLGTAEPIINPDKRKLKRKLTRLQPKLAFPLSTKYFAFDYSAIIDVMYNNNLGNVDHSGVGKKLKNYGLGYASLWTRDVIEWEGTKELAALMVWKNRDKQQIPEWTKDRRVGIEKIKGNLYRATTYSKDSSQIFECRVEAIMPLTALFAFAPEKWKTDYQKTMAKVKSTREAYRQTADVFRDYEVQGFGIYNWDKLWKQENRVELAADFRFPNASFNDTLYQPEIVFLPGDGKSLVRLPKNTWSALSIVPDKRARMFSILPGNTIAVFPAIRYAKIDFDELRKTQEPEFIFKMEDPVAFNSEEDLRKVIGL